MDEVIMGAKDMQGLEESKGVRQLKYTPVTQLALNWQPTSSL